MIESTSLVYNNQLKFIDDYLLKNKQRTSAKRISAEDLFKPGSSPSLLSIRFPSQETITARVKLKPPGKKSRNTWKIIRKQYKNNKVKIAPTWNDKFELQDGSYVVPDIQDYNEYMIKKTIKQQQFLLFMFKSIELTIID